MPTKYAPDEEMIAITRSLVKPDDGKMVDGYKPLEDDEVDIVIEEITKMVDNGRSKPEDINKYLNGFNIDPDDLLGKLNQRQYGDPQYDQELEKAKQMIREDESLGAKITGRVAPSPEMVQQRAADEVLFEDDGGGERNAFGFGSLRPEGQQKYGLDMDSLQMGANLTGDAVGSSAMMMATGNPYAATKAGIVTGAILEEATRKAGMGINAILKGSEEQSIMSQLPEQEKESVKRVVMNTPNSASEVLATIAKDSTMALGIAAMGKVASSSINFGKKGIDKLRNAVKTVYGSATDAGKIEELSTIVKPLFDELKETLPKPEADEPIEKFAVRLLDGVNTGIRRTIHESAKSATSIKISPVPVDRKMRLGQGLKEAISGVGPKYDQVYGVKRLNAGRLKALRTNIVKESSGKPVPVSRFADVVDRISEVFHHKSVEGFEATKNASPTLGKTLNSVAQDMLEEMRYFSLRNSDDTSDMLEELDTLVKHQTGNKGEMDRINDLQWMLLRKKHEKAPTHELDQLLWFRTKLGRMAGSGSTHLRPLYEEARKALNEDLDNYFARSVPKMKDLWRKYNKESFNVAFLDRLVTNVGRMDSTSKVFSKIAKKTLNDKESAEALGRLLNDSYQDLAGKVDAGELVKSHKQRQDAYGALVSEHIMQLIPNPSGQMSMPQIVDELNIMIHEDGILKELVKHSGDRMKGIIPQLTRLKEIADTFRHIEIDKTKTPDTLFELFQSTGFNAMMEKGKRADSVIDAIVKGSVGGVKNQMIDNTVDRVANGIESVAGLRFNLMEEKSLAKLVTNSDFMKWYTDTYKALGEWARDSKPFGMNPQIVRSEDSGLKGLTKSTLKSSTNLNNLAWIFRKYETVLDRNMDIQDELLDFFNSYTNSVYLALATKNVNPESQADVGKMGEIQDLVSLLSGGVNQNAPRMRNMREGSAQRADTPMGGFSKFIHDPDGYKYQQEGNRPLTGADGKPQMPRTMRRRVERGGY